MSQAYGYCEFFVNCFTLDKQNDKILKIDN